MRVRNQPPTLTHEEALEYFEKFRRFALASALKWYTKFNMTYKEAESCAYTALWQSSRCTVKPYCMRYIRRYVYGYMCTWSKTNKLIRTPLYWKEGVSNLPEIVPLDETVMCNRYHTGKSFFSEDDIQELRSALSELSPIVRTAVTLYYLEDKTLQESGDIMGITREYVRLLCEKGLGQLRSLLSKYKDDEVVARWSTTRTARRIRLEAIRQEAKTEKSRDSYIYYLKHKLPQK